MELHHSKIHQKCIVFAKVFVTIMVLWSTQSCKTEEETVSQQPNFIFIAVDDLNVYNTVLGAMPGNFLHKVYPDSVKHDSVIQRLTPNIDILASEGLAFDFAYCASPLCGPSRTSLLTGVPPHVSGYYQHDQHFRGYQTLTDVVTLPQYLKQNGYYTAGVGKVFHKERTYLDRGVFSDWPDRIFSWTDWVDTYTGTGPAHDSEKRKVTETLSPYYRGIDGRTDDYTRFGTTDLPAQLSNDYLNAKMISELITTGKVDRVDIHGEKQSLAIPESKPFFIACGLFAPHLPWVVPQEFYELFPMSEMSITRELLDWVKEDIKDLSPSGLLKTTNTSFDKLLMNGLEIEGEGGDVNAWRAAFQAYLAAVAYSDNNVGVLLNAIKNNPRYDNTVVVLWSDHGYHMGDKNSKGKTTLWEASNRCNLIIYDPRNIETSSGKSCTALVSLQDVYPTIVSLAQLERPSHIYGYDLAPLLENAESEWNYPVLSTYQEGNHTLRTKQYRYLRFKNGDRELYDHLNDPFEFTNLATDTTFDNKLIEMDDLLNKTLAKKPGEL